MLELMTLDELANYLRVTQRTIYRLLKRGSIPAMKVGQRWRFDKTLINKWLSQKVVVGVANILVIDDDKIIRVLFGKILVELGHNVTVVADSSEGLELVKKHDFDIVFLDLKIPKIDGAELFRQIKIVKPTLPVVIVTGYPDSELMARALAQGPFGIMNKPFGESDIVAALNNFLRITKMGKDITKEEL